MKIFILNANTQRPNGTHTRCKFKTKRCFKTFARDLAVLQYCAPVQMDRWVDTGRRNGTSKR